MCVYRPKETTSSISLIIVNTRPKETATHLTRTVAITVQPAIRSVPGVLTCDVILKKAPVPVQLAVVTTRTIKTLLGCHFNYVNPT
jgi:hypothetical protein